MCGRYYIDDETAREIDKLVRQVDESLRKSELKTLISSGKDIHPTELAPVLAGNSQGQLCCRLQRWGLPGFKGSQVIFNARSETVSDKKMFQEGIKQRRIIIPATWFYEWDKNKCKHTFYREDQSITFMAGIYNLYQNEERFAILTTAANESMSPVHDRMPLILERDELSAWISDKKNALNILRKTPCLLDKRTEFEQLSLF